MPFVFGFRLSKDETGKPDFGPVLRSLEELERTEAAMRDWYRDNPVSVLMLAQATRRSAVRILAFLAANRDLPIRCCVGTAGEFEGGRRIATTSSALVADPVALATLFYTGLYKQIKSLPFKLVVCRSALQEIQHFAEEERTDKSDETLVRHKGEVVRIARSPESRERLVADLTDFVTWITANAEIRSGIPLTTLPFEKRQLLLRLFGQPAAESAAVAAAEHLGLWTDDVALAGYAGHELQLARTWTQLVAERVRDSSGLSSEHFVELLLNLIACGYFHTQCMPEVLLRAAQQASWDASRSPFLEVLDWVSNDLINIDGVAPVAIGSLQLFWRNTLLVHQREESTLALCRALLSRRDGRQVVLVMARDIERIFPLEPLNSSSRG